MKLLTKEIIKNLPPLYSGEDIPLKDKIVWVKFFTPWTFWTWYIMEGTLEGGDMIMFGYVVGDYPEFGNVSLRELQEVRGPVGLRIERDLHWTPKPCSEIPEIIIL
jgi:hypothetical protein